MRSESSPDLLDILPELARLEMRPRIADLKKKIMRDGRRLSLEQALIITESYRSGPEEPKILKRARAFAASLERIEIEISEGELIVGNRTRGLRDGVVFPEAGNEWLKREIDTLGTRAQDPFEVRAEDRERFFAEIVPFWKGKTLEDHVHAGIGALSAEISKVVKINQQDHAQGHIIPDVAAWLRKGPAELRAEAEEALASAKEGRKRSFYEAVSMALAGASTFMERYAFLADGLAADTKGPRKEELIIIANTCRALATRPAMGFREALQAVWFLFVMLHMESNASSFSPGRMDQYLLPYFREDLASGALDLGEALELLESLYLSFNKIVYMRNSESAKYFAGFPIGFNVTIGGQNATGADATNGLSFLFLKAQEHLGLPQPNLTARLFRASSDAFVDECAKVIGRGSGMPQVVNDESIIPALRRVGIEASDAAGYGLVGCVELSTQGNNLGWSDAAMFNLVKALELTLNDGVCLQSGKKMGLATGTLDSYEDFPSLLEAYREQIHHFMGRMIEACDFVDRAHAVMMPSAFLSSVIDSCMDRGMDVTSGGATYNLSGIQAIQVANVADSLAVLKRLVFDERKVDARRFLEALRTDWKGEEKLRQTAIHHVPKYGNDEKWVDSLGADFTAFFADLLEGYTNARGGPYHMGLYTVSAHVPMGKNVGASPDGRMSGSPLADGGVSPMYGRDQKGPTAILKSVAVLDSSRASNGTLLNMKFVPSFFTVEEDRRKFDLLLRSFVASRIHHIQFNVVSRKDLLDAQLHPERWRSLTIRVAGYTAYFTELAADLQDEIIARTSHGETA